MPNSSTRQQRSYRLRCAQILLSTTLAQTWATASCAAETCRYVGTTDYAGHLSVVTTAAADGDTTRLDVTVRFEATTALWLHLSYLIEEITRWRNEALVRMDVNTRYILAGHVVRQQWDEFRPAANGLEAYRIQGKRNAQFLQRYPHFARHWNVAAFGQPWLDDYASAAPDRRPDLDLSAQSGGVQSPFALAFYWVRFLNAGAQPLRVFLPGFKADKLADIAMAPVATGDGRLWRADLHHPYLGATPPSSAAAHISPDRHLLRLSFEAHFLSGWSAGGVLHQAGCAGTAVP
jgi:hypothetical protein